MANSERPDIEDQLVILREKCPFVWVALSTSSLIDTTTSHHVPEGKLEPMVPRCGFSSVYLKNILRNSSRISEASTAEHVARYNQSAKAVTLAEQTGSISMTWAIEPGKCNTVIGEKPTWYLFQNPSIEKLVDCVKKHMNAKKYERVAILCDRGISPRQVKPYLAGDIIFYEGEVEVFEQIDIERLDRDRDYFTRPSKSDPAELAKQKEDLERWLDQGGILLTHERMFRGCESEAVILISGQWSLIQGQRS